MAGGAVQEILSVLSTVLYSEFIFSTTLRIPKKVKLINNSFLNIHNERKRIQLLCVHNTAENVGYYNSKHRDSIDQCNQKKISYLELVEL